MTFNNIEISDEILIKKIEYVESISRTNPLKSLKLIEELEVNIKENSEEMLECLYYKSMALWLLGKFKESLIESNKLLNLGKILNSDKACASAHKILGNVFYHLGNREYALENYIKGLSFSIKNEEIEIKRIRASLKNNIGEIYNSYYAYDKALEYYLDSVQILQDMDEVANIGVSYLNIAEVHYELSDMENSLKFVKIALNKLTENDDYIGIAIAHSVLGKIYKFKKKYKKAHEELNLAIEIMNRIQDKMSIIGIYQLMIELLLDEKNLDEALDYANDALDKAQELNVFKEIKDCYLILAEIYDLKKNFEKSLEYYREYVIANETYELEKNNKYNQLITTQIKIGNEFHEKELYKSKNIELKARSEEIKKIYSNVKIINEIGKNITSTLDFNKILHLVYKNLNKLMDASYFGIMIYDEKKKILNRELFLEDGKEIFEENIPIDDSESMAALCMKNKEPIIINDCNKAYKTIDQSHELITQSLIMVPLLFRDEVIGVVTVQSFYKNKYSDYDLEMIMAMSSYIAIAINNSQKSKALEVSNTKLSEMSFIDELTRVNNRRSFVTYLTHELKNANRNDEVISLLMIDLDYFKEYNDNYGHVSGDQCLIEVAKILSESIKRSVDFVARYGGDEFIIILPNTKYEGAKIVCEKIMNNLMMKNIEHHFSKKINRVTITMGGISFIPNHEDSIESIIHKADEALYIAKLNGKNQYNFYNKA